MYYRVKAIAHYESGDDVVEFNLPIGVDVSTPRLAYLAAHAAAHDIFNATYVNGKKVDDGDDLPEVPVSVEITQCWEHDPIELKFSWDPGSPAIEVTHLD